MEVVSKRCLGLAITNSSMNGEINSLSFSQLNAILFRVLQKTDNGIDLAFSAVNHSVVLNFEFGFE